MGFLYLIHYLNWGRDLENRMRNCRTVIAGMLCYTLIFVFVRQLQHSFGVYTDGVTYGLVVMLITDVSVMAYIYRSYYGRNLMHELTSKDEDQANWVFDKTTHKYRRPTDADIAKANEDLERAIRTETIRTTKSKIRAAIFIQRWWRDRLYRPPNGILFLRAQADWKSALQSVQ